MASSAPGRPRPSAVALAFLLAFAATLTVALLQGTQPFYYDAGAYWQLGETFTVHGHFSLLNFDDPLRGYLWPLGDHLLHLLAAQLSWSDSLIAKIANVLAFVLVGAVLAPRLAELTWPNRRWGWLRRVALVALMLVFWNGYLAYPLTDLPALAMTMLALVSLAHPESPGWCALGGAACAAAIDMRPSYELLAPVLALMVCWTWWEQRNRAHGSLWRRALCAGALVGAFALVSLPQSLISHRHFATWSFIPGTAAHLTTFQLTEGLSLQRYETYVGAGHAPQMRYVDASGERLLQTQAGGRITSVGQYLGLILSHPVTMAGVFTRHIVNGFDQRYSTPYVPRLDTGGQRWLRLSSFTLLFLALLRLVWPASRRIMGRARWRYPLALLACCLTAVPSAMETRYLLPAYVMIYAIVLMPGWAELLTAARSRALHLRTAAFIAGAYVLFVGLVLYIANGASNSLHFG